MIDTVVKNAPANKTTQQVSRGCTRCDGTQHLIGESFGFGKYRCDQCEMSVGFDLSAETPEFLISRGLAARYTKDMFNGIRLNREELRIFASSEG